MKNFRDFLAEEISRDTRSMTELLVDEVYSRYIDDHDKNSIECVGWLDGTENAQLRFQKIYEGGIGDDDSVLDVGCGVAHFYHFMKNQGWTGKYLGIDPNLAAIQLIDEEINTKCGTIEDLDDSKHDWVVSSGVFNIGINESHAWWIIHNMIKRAEKGIVFNMLTHPYQSKSYECYIPEEVETKLKEYDHRKIEIVDGYFSGEEEFTVYFYNENK